ncbi:MAG: hypothetical protein IT184_16120 [Acidobacteria bacterium]|nr:hypothetical protein [Acidobacteriota bacterium]
MARRRASLVLAVLGGAVLYIGFVATPPGPRDIRRFDPVRTAEREIEMWRAYYEKRNVRLFALLVAQTRETYRCSWWTASRIAFSLARAAATFGGLRGEYAHVLPDLEDGYARAKAWTGAAYDPAALARAELAWWVARRMPGQDSPEQVGGLIADLNAMLYDVPRERVLEASVLRARAGKLRDDGGVNADWAEVSRLLHESYRKLADGVTSLSPARR